MVFFHSHPVPELREWDYPFPFPFPNTQMSFPLTLGDGDGDEGDGGGEGDDFSALPASGAQLYPVVEMEVKAEAALEFCFLSSVIMIMMVMTSIMMMMPECL